ncbi:MAG TPA: hypothetical protein V6D03_08365, partial [Candidatus Caenarcaniphilales bacterium]
RKAAEGGGENPLPAHFLFDALLPIFSEVYEQTCRTQPRQRAIGGGRKARLRHIQNKQFFILFYFKCYPTMGPSLHSSVGQTLPSSSAPP